MERATRLFLQVMLIVVLFVSALTIIFSFSNLRLAIEMVNRTLADCREHFLTFKTPPPTEAGLNPLDQAYLDQLRAASASALEADTVTFLFTVISIFIVSASVYALQHALQQANKALGYSKGFASIGRDGSLVATIASYLSASHGMAFALSAIGTIQARQHYTPALRDTMRASRRSLEAARTGGVGIEQAQQDSFHDIAQSTVGVLKCLSWAADIKDLIEEGEKVVEILKDTDFGERFREKMRSLPA